MNFWEQDVIKNDDSHVRACDASGRRWPARALHDLGPSRGRLQAAWWVVVVGWPGGLTLFGMERWSLLLHLPLSLIRQSRTCVCVEPLATMRGRPASPWRAAGRRIGVASEWRKWPVDTE